MLPERPTQDIKTDDADIRDGENMDDTSEDISVDRLFEELISRMERYHPSSDFTLVERAFRLAREAHEGQMRKSGEPYIVHPLKTALILAELELDRETIAAGILHDIIEDTSYTYADLKTMFSEEVANLVDGVTKLNIYAKKRSESSVEEEQAENYRKMFLAMAHDIRVILIKIADRLHNLRTLKAMPEEKQRRIAQESLDIYAPLAGRLGISTLRREMEDLSLKYSDAEKYFELKESISMRRSERLRHVETIENAIKDVLVRHKISARVEGRPKHFFSIYKKMKTQDKSIDEIFDLFAVRVILDTTDKHQCYAALGAVRSVFRPIPERLKDYIAIPKSNDYQSIHDSLIGPGGDVFEVQIRTDEMHRVAEYGIAAHWKYRENITGSDGSETKLNWLKEILEWHRDTPDNREFLEDLKGDLDVYSDHIHVFTPKGEVKILVKGSTCIDYAYSIHSAVGNRMTGAKVDKAIQPKEYVLKNGEQVEILTSRRTKGPTADWLKIAKTSQAKNKIKQWLKKENKEESIARGKVLLEAAAKLFGLPFSKLLIPEGIEKVLTRFSYRDMDTLYASVGRGAVRESTIAKRLYAEYIIQNPEAAPEALADAGSIDVDKVAAAKQRHKETIHVGDVIIDGEDGLAMRYSQCCGPVYGDEIVGFITRGRGVSVHRSDCINVANMSDMERERLVGAQWNPRRPDSNKNFYVELSITCVNLSLITMVTQVFGKMDVGIHAINAREVYDEAVLTAAISVADRDELDLVTTKLNGLHGVHEVKRVTA